MSTILAVCGVNHCTFIADTRRCTIIGDEWVPVDESTQKIFKINDRVLFGMTGVFGKTETITAPLDVYPDKSIITLRQAYKAVLDYLKNGMPDAMRRENRNYMVGGKDNKGQFCVYEIEYNPSKLEPIVTLRKPEPPKFNHSLSYALPRNALPFEDGVKELLTLCIESSETHEQMVEKLPHVVEYIAAADHTVNTNTQVFYVT